MQIRVPDERSIPSDLISFVLKHQEGKQTRIGMSNVENGRLQTAFSLGDGVRKIGRTSEIRVTIPTAVHTETIDLDLRDVPLRR